MMTRKSKKRLGALAAAFMAAMAISAQAFAAGIPSPDPDYDPEKAARLEDNVMEYEELTDLVKAYNPTVLGQITSVYNDSIEQMKNLENDFKQNARKYDKWMKDLRDEHGFSDTGVSEVLDIQQKLAQNQATEADLAKTLERTKVDPNVLGDYTTYMVNKGTFQAIAKGYHDMVDIYEGAAQTMSIDDATNQIVSGTQQLMNQYNQLLSQKALTEKNTELNRAMYNLKNTQMQAGLATQVEVLAARKDMLTAESNQLQVESGLKNVKQTLCMMTGWSWDGNPEIQGIPLSDVTRIAGMNPQSDAQKAVNNNVTVRSQRHSLPKGNSKDKSNAKRTLGLTEEKAASGLTDLYNQVLQRKAEYDSAVTAYEKAVLDKGKADRSHQAGLISDIQYLGASVSFEQKKSAKECADMALFQAMETYDWGVAGLISIQ